VHPVGALAVVGLLSGCGGSHEALQLHRVPYFGPACDRTTVHRCDRGGLAVWLVHPASGISAVVRRHSCSSSYPFGRLRPVQEPPVLATLLPGSSRATVGRHLGVGPDSDPGDRDRQLSINRDARGLRLRGIWVAPTPSGSFRNTRQATDLTLVVADDAKRAQDHARPLSRVQAASRSLHAEIPVQRLGWFRQMLWPAPIRRPRGRSCGTSGEGGS
jgi:hypothetical protein